MIWPEKLSKGERSAIKAMLDQANANSKSQVVLDELAANIAKGTVRNHVGYARALINRLRAGDFIAEKADQIARRRQSEMRYQELLKRPPT